MLDATDHFILDQMEEGFKALQGVRSGDVDAAYRNVLAGGRILRPASSDSAAEWLHGRLLALDAVYNGWYA